MSSDRVESQTGIKFEVAEVLDDQNTEKDTIGVCESVEPGEMTIVQENARGKFWLTRDFLDQDSDRVFISCDGGEVAVTVGPQFAPVETNITVGQYRAAMSELGGYRRPDYTLMFDDSGLVAFEADGDAVVCAPMVFDWDCVNNPVRPKV